MDWDSIAEKLKEVFDEDTVKNLIDTLKQAVAAGAPGAPGAAGLKPDELAAALGRIFGKFGAGAVGGATGLDPDLLRFLLELLGPLARDALGELIKSFLGDGEHFRTVNVGGHKYSKIVKDPPGANTEEDFAPDIKMTDTARFQCHDGKVQITLRLQVKCREEPIESVQALGMGVAGAQTYVAIENAGEKKIPEKGKQNVGDRYEVTFQIDVPCTALFNNGGVMIFAVTVEDEDGNQMIDFVEADAADFLLKDKCCGTEIDETLRARLLEIIRTGMRPLTPADLERLIELIVRPRTEARPAPSTPAPPSETAPKTPAPKIPSKKTGAGVKLGELLVEIPIEEIETFEEDLEIAPPPNRRGGQSIKPPR